MEGIDDTRTPAGEDAATQSAVLHHLLAIHPVQVTLEELVREIEERPRDFARHDAIERAVRELTGVGLLHSQDAFVVPSHAALRFDELADL